MREPHRRSIRLKGYDYTQPGYYAVTICTWRKECIQGEYTAGKIGLSPLGEIVSACVQDIPAMVPAAVVDTWVIMPNHLHLVVQLQVETIAGASASLRVSDIQRPAALPGIIQTFKATATRRVNASLGMYGAGNTLWQRNYYEHIIRNERELRAHRSYICNNPANWQCDVDNPAHVQYANY